MSCDKKGNNCRDWWTYERREEASINGKLGGGHLGRRKSVEECSAISKRMTQYWSTKPSIIRLRLPRELTKASQAESMRLYFSDPVWFRQYTLKKRQNKQESYMKVENRMRIRPFFFNFERWVWKAHFVWVMNNGPIPSPGLGNRFFNYVIHHKDGNPMNDSPENLELSTRRDHMNSHGIQILSWVDRKRSKKPKKIIINF